MVRIGIGEIYRPMPDDEERISVKTDRRQLATVS